MAKKKARIVEKQGAITPNGRDAVLQLREGEVLLAADEEAQAYYDEAMEKMAKETSYE